MLRSSPTWNGRCWSAGTPASGPSAGCDPHRLGMAGAGSAEAGRLLDALKVAILTDLEWPVLAAPTGGVRRTHEVAILTDLEWPVLAVYQTLHCTPFHAVAILTDLEWPVLDRNDMRVLSGTHGVAILTDLELPVLAPCLLPGRQDRSSCCDPHRLGMAGAGDHPCGTRAAAPCGCDPHRLGMAGAGSRPGPGCTGPFGCDPHRLGMAGAGAAASVAASAADGLRSSPTWNGRCWHVHDSRRSQAGWPLRSSPTWNGRCWQERQALFQAAP